VRAEHLGGRLIKFINKYNLDRIVQNGAERIQCFQCAFYGGTQDEFRCNFDFPEVTCDQDACTPAQLVEGAVKVEERWAIPTRFCVTQQNSLFTRTSQYSTLNYKGKVVPMLLSDSDYRIRTRKGVSRDLRDI